MFLLLVWVESGARNTPAPGKTAINAVVPSLSEYLRTFSTVVVTGGSSGIGKSFIELCGKLHAGLTVCNLSRRDPGKIFSGKRLNHFPCDLSRSAEVERVAGALGEFLQREVPAGRVLLINNSGFGAYGAFPEPNLAHQLEMIDVNVRAVVDLTGRLLPLLRERGGAIVNVASTAAFQPTAWMATYGATKAFLLHWSLALNEELRGRGVRTLAVCPGPTTTEFGRRAGLKPGSAPPMLSMTSEEVVGISLRALAAGRSQVVTGWKNKSYVAVSSRLPKPVAARVGAKVLAQLRLKKVGR
ncbi:MAG: SDR family NAD(P)-dependent oxidoreductase [Verrucomicrobia bacterium]|nr:SDR family NAD(P)-dependent oxidoreductase [Verrucomicrobiota bacterium]